MVGHFALGIKQYDGQTIKTLAIYDQLVKKYGKNAIEVVDTRNWKRRPVDFILKCIKCAKLASDVIIMPASRGARILVPLFTFFKKRYNYLLHYILIGGKIYVYVENDEYFRECMKKVDYVYAENNSVIKRLKKDDIKNVLYMPNFKNLSSSSKKRKFEKNDSLKCCIFQRLEENKGVVDAVDVINRYNDTNKKKVFLDIYGKVKPDFEEIFIELMKNNKYIKYCGIVEPNKSVETVEKYDLLIFPTKCRDEGIPGTIIDAYFAGTPVLASRWNNFNEIIDEGKTGFGYKFNDIDDFYKKLECIAEDKRCLSGLSRNCIVRADEYTPERAMVVLCNNIIFNNGNDGRNSYETK